ncbi:MAG: hydrogenase maturation protease [Gaiellaceae bacterium]
MSGRRVVVGVGNAYRGDDAVGIAVAERLRGRVPQDVDVVECEQEPSRLLDAWHGADLALVVDACASGEPPGTVHRFDVSGEPLPARVFRSSTHAFGVGDAVELARALERLPPQVVVYGVEGGQFAAGAGLSPEVESAVEQVADEVIRELRGDSLDA